MKILVTPRPGIISCNILLGSMFHCWYFGREKLWGGGGGGSVRLQFCMLCLLTATLPLWFVSSWFIELHFSLSSSDKVV